MLDFVNVGEASIRISPRLATSSVLKIRLLFRVKLVTNFLKSAAFLQQICRGATLKLFCFAYHSALFDSAWLMGFCSGPWVAVSTC